MVHARSLALPALAVLLAAWSALAAGTPAGAAAEVAPAAIAASPPATESPVATTDPVAGLTLTNSFVSAVGWVKPGEAYPSRLLLTNTTAGVVNNALVQVTAPLGTAFTAAAGDLGSVDTTASTVTWTIPSVPADSTLQLVLSHQTATVDAVPTLVWRDLSTTATLTVGAASAGVNSHGPKVIPPGGGFDTARYGDRPFPVVPVAYTDRDYQASNSGDELASVINDPANEGSTFNLFQEMSLGQLYPHGTVPSAGLDGVAYADGFEFTTTDPTATTTCTGTTLANLPLPSSTYGERISNGVYQLPGSTGYYGADGAGSAVLGSLTGVTALMQTDSGCGPTGKLIYDAVRVADPEIDYSDYDTDKDGVVDFFMAVFAGCGGHGASQLSIAGCPYTDLPYDNIWPHSSSVEYTYSDPRTGLPGVGTDDQLKDLRGRPLWYADTSYSTMTTTNTGDALKVFVRVGPYNVNPEDAIDHASVISHEYGHSLGLPDFYSLGSRETYGSWNLMASDHSQNMDIFSRQELGWVVPEVLEADTAPTVTGWTDSKQDTDEIHWQTADGTPYTLREGVEGRVQNSQAYVAKLPGRVLLDPAAFEAGEGASATHAWWSGSGNDFGCASDGGGHNIDLLVPGAADLPAGSSLSLELKSMFDTEWDYDYGFVLTTTDGGENWASQPSERSVPTTTPTSNPNQAACQDAYGNGITGSSASYVDALTVQGDRTLGNYPAAEFIADSFDISELAGADLPALRFSYATDPALARPGWFIDDVTVTATLPNGSTQELLVTDFETDGGPDDPRVYNGGCHGDDAPGGGCTAGWTYVDAGAEASYDHAYYLELRDRSGFDLDGNGQSDRGEVDWAAGLSMVYTDEAHGYGNVGTDDPPAQTPLDSQPEPGSATPDLSDAAWTTATGDNAFTDADGSHVENYTDPANPASGDPWVFDFGCLAFTVQSLIGADDGPQESDGDLTGDVAFDLGAGCGAFDYGYLDVGTPPPPVNQAPHAVASASPRRPIAGAAIRLYGDQSWDTETPASGLTYAWDLGDGGTTVDATSANPVVRLPAGDHTVVLTVTDAGGKTDSVSVDLHVWQSVGCGLDRVRKGGSWRLREGYPGVSRSNYCDNLGNRSGKDTLALDFAGDTFEVHYGVAQSGGRARVFVDGVKIGVIRFAGATRRPTFTSIREFSGLGVGEHTVRLVVVKGQPAYVDRFVVE